ncbi:Acyl-CoA dehydrogenase, short-chain specific [plant metagenome]|uniref:Acyl-CoA dehydrogenase, short-chain specific n=1 Tax=plant metagenome TaxID=1297885 RepID=A0A484P4Y2_9ZZZZ
MAHTRLSATLSDWLDTHAEAIDAGTHDPSAIVPTLGAAGLFRLGVPGAGDSSRTGDAILAIAEVARHSLAAAFVYWSQRTFIEYLLQSPNATLRERLLPGLLTGATAGATGLSNAMKFLCGIEALQITAREQEGRWRLDGRMPWVTNLRPQGFHVAGAVTTPRGGSAIVALPHDAPGLSRSADLNLIALQSSNTAALALTDVDVPPEWLIHENAAIYLPHVRPAFVGLQCGLALGLAQRALEEAQASSGPRHALQAPLAQASHGLATLREQLIEGVHDGRYRTAPTALFELRISLAELAAQAVQLELRAHGGAAYLNGKRPGFARRWREAAFVPIVTPSVVQLQTEIAKRRAVDGVDAA